MFASKIPQIVGSDSKVRLAVFSPIITRLFQGQLSPWTNSAPLKNIHSPFRPKKALVLTKLSRYEFEKRRHSDLSDEQLVQKLAERGSDLNSLLYHHEIHTKCKDAVTKTLQECGLETKVVYRFDYTRDLVDWADVILPIGGDGTYLLAASRIQDCGKPVIGINSDPTRSEGYLCLPKKYATCFPEAMKKLLTGKFKWTWRQRIRITVIGERSYDPPIELHDQQLMYPEYRFMDCLQEQHPASSMQHKINKGDTRSPRVRILPVLSLNEVFIGESLSSRVSYYEMSTDGGDWIKQKSSGVTISTGTGSSSWTFNISKLTPQCVEDLLNIVSDETKLKLPNDAQFVQRVMSKFNSSLLFDPSEKKLAYTIRDPVYGASMFVNKPRGFANRIEIKSRCFDACLVIDGGLSFAFNDGTKAIFDMHESDALKTVVLDEDD